MYLSLKRFTCSELDRFQYIVPLYINITRGTTYAGQWTQAISSLKLELSLQLKREKIQFQHFYPLSTPWWPPFPPCTPPCRPTRPPPSQWQSSPTHWVVPNSPTTYIVADMITAPIFPAALAPPCRPPWWPHSSHWASPYQPTTPPLY